MRLWYLHPRYLDRQGLVALWREALLAQAVLRDETRGYRSHPQLARFRAHAAPRAAIAAYLSAVHAEANARGYAFDGTKIRGDGEPASGTATAPASLSVASGQLAYEWAHLLAKLRARSPDLHRRWQAVDAPDAHPLFAVRDGDVEAWERR